jgi:outer membrane protein assembly factor BamB
MLRRRPGLLRRLPPPERRRRSDVVVALGIAVVVAVAAGVMWATAPHTGTVSTPAATSVPDPPAATAVPDRFVEAWRAPSGASPVPVLSGPVVVTGDGGTVDGRDPETGQVRWSYRRDIPLCTVAAGFPEHDDGRALALYRNDSWCSELTSLHPDTGTRDRQRNLDVHPGTRLLEGGSLVTATGPTYLEVFRSDLVQTVEYGDVPTPRQVGRQPRPTCTAVGYAVTAGRVAVLQRCPGEPNDRLSVLDPDGAEADKPQEEFSVLLPARGATLVAASDDRVAVALPNPPRLEVLDRSGAQVGLVALDVPAADLARPPADGVTPVSTDDHRVYWWTGSRTVALDGLDLTPDWTRPDTLGPGTVYAGQLVMPVPAGVAVLDAATGDVERTLPVPRPEGAVPVSSAVLGDVLLEQRGPDLVALRPTSG